MERVLYSKFSNDRKKKFCIRTDIVENNGVNSVKKVPLYEEGKSHIAYINQIYELLCQQYRDSNVVFNKCELKNDAVYLEYIPCKTLQMIMEDHIDRNNEAAIKELLNGYMEAIQRKCKKHKFVKTEEFIKVFGDVDLPDGYMSLEVTDIDLIFSNIMVGDKWEVIDYEWTFTFPIPIKYVIYRAFFLAHHQMRRCSVLELDNLMHIADISIQEQEIFQKMEENFQKHITGKCIPFRDVIFSTGTKRTTIADEFSRRDQEIIKRDEEIRNRDNEIIKRDQEIRNRDTKILELIELNQQVSQNLLYTQAELEATTQKKDEQILQLISQIDAIEGTKWWKLRGAILKILQK